MINDGEAFEGETETWMGSDFPTAVLASTPILISLDSGRQVSDLYIVPDVGFLGRLILKLISQ